MSACATEVEQRYTGWHVWLASNGKPVATRTGNQRPPADDDRWAKTIIADTWKDLEIQLAEQP